MLYVVYISALPLPPPQPRQRRPLLHRHHGLRQQPRRVERVLQEGLPRRVQLQGAPGLAEEALHEE